MIKVNRKIFFDECRTHFGKLIQAQVDALEELLSYMEQDAHLTDVRWLAYMFATIKLETGNTFRPIREYGRGKGRKYGIPYPKTGLVYYGRGLTQNTWYENYLTLTVAWNKQHPEEQLDFTKTPDLLLQMKYSYWAMSYGMRTGLYTGKRLSHYINEKGCNYVLARKIINGQDRAELIAGWAVIFEDILTEAKEV